MIFFILRSLYNTWHILLKCDTNNINIPDKQVSLKCQSVKEGLLHKDGALLYQLDCVQVSGVLTGCPR